MMPTRSRASCLHILFFSALLWSEDSFLLQLTLNLTSKWCGSCVQTAQLLSVHTHFPPKVAEENYLHSLEKRDQFTVVSMIKHIFVFYPISLL